MLRTPPPEFVRDLTAYDRDLRVRHAFRIDKWFIETKMPERLLRHFAGRPNPWKSPRGHDLYDGWKDGYDHVLTVKPDDLHWSFVQPLLAWADAHRHGGWQRLNDALDAMQDEEQRAADTQIAHWVEAATNEAYDVLQWRYGNRIAMHEPARPGLPAEQIEQRDGYVVRDRRRVTA